VRSIMSIRRSSEGEWEGQRSRSRPAWGNDGLHADEGEGDATLLPPAVAASTRRSHPSAAAELPGGTTLHIGRARVYHYSHSACRITAAARTNPGTEEAGARMGFNHKARRRRCCCFGDRCAGPWCAGRVPRRSAARQKAIGLRALEHRQRLPPTVASLRQNTNSGSVSLVYSQQSPAAPFGDTRV